MEATAADEPMVLQQFLQLGIGNAIVRLYSCGKPARGVGAETYQPVKNLLAFVKPLMISLMSSTTMVWSAHLSKRH